MNKRGLGKVVPIYQMETNIVKVSINCPILLMNLCFSGTFKSMKIIDFVSVYC